MYRRMIVGLLAVVLIICNGCQSKNESDPTTTSTPTSTPETPATSAPALTTTSTPALTTTSTNTVSGFLEVKERIDCPTMQLNTILMDNELIGLSWFDNRIEIFDLEKQVLRLTKESYKIKNQTSIIGNNIYFFYSDFLETDIPLIRYDIDARKFYEYNSADLGFHIINGITANSKYIYVQGHENKIAKIDLSDNKVESIENPFGEDLTAIHLSNEKMWVSILGEGLREYPAGSGFEGNYKLYNTDNSLISNDVWSISESRDKLWIRWGIRSRGDMWSNSVTSGYGLSYLDLNSGQCSNFIISDNADYSDNQQFTKLRSYNSDPLFNRDGIPWVYDGHILLVFDDRDCKWLELNIKEPGIDEWFHTSLMDVSAYRDWFLLSFADGFAQINKISGEVNWIINDDPCFYIGEYLNQLLVKTNQQIVMIGEKSEDIN